MIPLKILTKKDVEKMLDTKIEVLRNDIYKELNKLRDRILTNEQVVKDLWGKK